MAFFRVSNGGTSYTFPFTITLSCNHDASAPQNSGASVTLPLIGGLLTSVRTITASFASKSIFTGECKLLNSNGGVVKSLTNGNNNVSSYTNAQWDSITAIRLSSAHYTGAGGYGTVGSVTFKTT